MPTDASWWLSSAQKTSSEALFAEAGSVGAERACSKAEAGIVLNVPTVLTLMRVAAVPALAWAFFQGGVAAAAAFWCFAGAAITDFMDGYLAITGAQTNSPTEYDFVGGIFDAALVEYRPKSPKIACFRACGAPWDAIRVGVARRGTYFFCPKW